DLAPFVQRIVSQNDVGRYRASHSGIFSQLGKSKKLLVRAFPLPTFFGNRGVCPTTAAKIASHLHGKTRTCHWRRRSDRLACCRSSRARRAAGSAAGKSSAANRP